ncbi:MAG TPA: PLP-dependent aminotransferase family protein [Pyrinomonadaceae bacterium]|jgi:GntR family transcriptional regulator/MocR family aminotransferase|nr:PLP-dependent aminotransferase family protein [Pyrinomonadaceae bacterium]
MPKTVSALELTLSDRPSHQTLSDWLYSELRGSILEGRLRPGARLPSSRDFARQHSLSRGTVVVVFERLLAEGYLSSRVGSGTWVSRRGAAGAHARAESQTPPAYVRRVISAYARPKAYEGWVAAEGRRPFQMRDPALDEFPAKLWGQLVARRSRTFKSWLRTEDDGRGYRPLREAAAHYLGSSRGVRCSADQVMIVSGVQQALDLLARLLLKRDDPVWVEDPAYVGATMAFTNAEAKLIPVPVDEQGLSVSAGVRACGHPRGMYLTPAHQFPLGMTMSLERRMEILKFAARVGAFVIEDDYDSEYRFEGRPVPALQSLDRGSSVIVVGSFSKLLFPSLRLGYVVLSPSLVDYFLAFRLQTDFRSVSLDQAVLCDFIEGGHLGRHLRRMRELYAGRLAALLEGAHRHLTGLLEISNIQAGLYTVGFLKNGMTSREAETAAAAHGAEAVALDRYTLRRRDPKGVLLGFAAFDEATIREGTERLAEAFCRRKARTR